MRSMLRAASALCLGSALGAGCSSARVGPGETGAPTLTLPARILEGEPDGGATGGAPSRPPPVAAPDAGLPAPRAAEAADPEPLTSDAQWEYRLRHRGGEVHLEGLRRVRLPRPLATPRMTGRFALELWIGRELVERRRFEFPLLAAEEPPPGARRPLHAPPRLDVGADVEVTVLVPDSPRATRAVLVDRLTGGVTRLPWPPVDGPDAGAAAAAVR